MAKVHRAHEFKPQRIDGVPEVASWAPFALPDLTSTREFFWKTARYALDEPIVVVVLVLVILLLFLAGIYVGMRIRFPPKLYRPKRPAGGGPAAAAAVPGPK